MKRVFTAQEGGYIRANYLQISGKAIATTLNCSKGVVQRFMKKAGLSVPKDVKERFRVQGMVGRTSYTEKEDALIKEHYLTMPIKRLVKNYLPGRSNLGVNGRLKALGLSIPPDIIEQRTKESQLKAGAVPSNKGKRQHEFMSKDGIERTKATRFKTGQLPHNTRSDHEISIRADKSGAAYKYIRVSLGKWVLYQRYVYENKIGKIPAGCLVVFKDGDSMNCAVENLELITRAELAIRNSGTLNLSDNTVARYLATRSRKLDRDLQQEILKYPDLVELKRQQLLLNRAIKNNDKDRN